MKGAEFMCLSCGCGKANDDHGDSRNITMRNIDQAAEAAGTTRERVVQNISQGGQASASQTTPFSQAGRGDYYQAPLAKESGRQPAEASPELGQAPGSAYQESQQMGETGFGGVQNPQANP